MTPSGLKDYLKEKRQASLADLVTHFRSTPQAIQAAMETWLRKGKAKLSTVESNCGKSCCKCNVESITIYYWLEEPAQQTM